MEPLSSRPSQPLPVAELGDSAGLRQPIQKPQPRVWVHAALFLATIATTTMMHGWEYSACLMLILTCHEFGHYFAARKHRVPASLPYFIPSPIPATLFGTFGAVIRMSPYIPNRRALFDIAAAGPVAGIIVALPITFWGMEMSTLQVKTALNGIELGDPLFLQAMEWWIFGASNEAYDVVLHPVAFAGWVGMFVTALNLLPIGQLDGGHIVHAVFGANSRYVSAAVFGGLAILTLTGGYGYIIFLALLWLMGIRHPPTLNDNIPLDPRRQRIAYVMLAIFILCFTPSPIQG